MFTRQLKIACAAALSFGGLTLASAPAAAQGCCGQAVVVVQPQPLYQSCGCSTGYTYGNYGYGGYGYGYGGYEYGGYAPAYAGGYYGGYGAGYLGGRVGLYGRGVARVGLRRGGFGRWR